MKSRRRGAAFRALFGLLLGLGTAASAAVVATPATLAYQQCNVSASGSVNPTSADGGQSVDFTATFKDCNGGGLNNATVNFSLQSAPTGCTATFNPTSARTDVNGTAHTSVTLPAGCPCQYVVAATSNGVTVTSTVRENGCLPFTAAARPLPSQPGPGPAVLLLVGGLILASAGGAYVLRSGRG